MKSQPQTYQANGKLLISGEYFVLAGAKALAVPLRFGQRMQVSELTESHDRMIDWQVFQNQQTWFHCAISNTDFKILETNSMQKAIQVASMLQHIHSHEPGLLDKEKKLLFTHHLDFNPEWGWGTSSTLVHNLACWSGINPYLLNKKFFHGSGYDVAVAGSSSPILFNIEKNIPGAEPVSFSPTYADQMFFIYLGKKQSTRASIHNLQETILNKKKLTNLVTDITLQMLQATSTKEMMALMKEHEQIVSGATGMKKVRDIYFHDFQGEVKSLGAWGGDFVMAVSAMPSGDVKKYFRHKGFHTIYNFKELVKNEQATTNKLAGTL